MPVTKSLVTVIKSHGRGVMIRFFSDTGGRCHRVECQGTTEKNEGSRESGPSHSGGAVPVNIHWNVSPVSCCSQLLYNPQLFSGRFEGRT